MNWLHSSFSHVCGQNHCWVLGGTTLPFCQRCTGLYVGAFCALIVILIFRPRPNAFLYWIHGLCLLVMIPFGFHMLAHGALVRTLTGGLFGFGLVYYLALNPFTAWGAWKEDSASRTCVYLLVVMLLLPLLLLTLRSGGEATALVMTGLGISGFASLSLLTTINLVVLPGTLRTLLFRSAAQSE